VQATGMGGPSAALVLADLAELGVRRAVRIGTCTALAAQLRPGALLTVTDAHAWGGLGGGSGAVVHPDPELTARLQEELGVTTSPATVASLDTLHAGGAPPPVEEGEAADMQTAALLGTAPALGVVLAAVLIVSQATDGEALDDEELEEVVKRAGRAAAAVL
jgi:uridine phosphorylase